MSIKGVLVNSASSENDDLERVYRAQNVHVLLDIFVIDDEPYCNTFTLATSESILGRVEG